MRRARAAHRLVPPRRTRADPDARARCSTACRSPSSSPRPRARDAAATLLARMDQRFRLLAADRRAPRPPRDPARDVRLVVGPAAARREMRHSRSSRCSKAASRCERPKACSTSARRAGAGPSTCCSRSSRSRSCAPVAHRASDCSAACRNTPPSTSAPRVALRAAAPTHGSRPVASWPLLRALTPAEATADGCVDLDNLTSCLPSCGDAKRRAVAVRRSSSRGPRSSSTGPLRRASRSHTRSRRLRLSARRAGPRALRCRLGGAGLGHLARARPHLEAANESRAARRRAAAGSVRRRLGTLAHATGTP